MVPWSPHSAANAHEYHTELAQYMYIAVKIGSLLQVVWW